MHLGIARISHVLGSGIFCGIWGGLQMIVLTRVSTSGRFTGPLQTCSRLCRIQAFSRAMTGVVSPYLPEFIPIENKKRVAKNISEGSIIRIISYNILAQAYVKSTLFPHSPARCLKWKTRSQSVLALLKSLEADFLCLQELDEFETFYKENMDKQGYSSVYIQRSGRKRDGCGIFYKRERYMNTQLICFTKPNMGAHKAELVSEQAIEYNDLVPPANEVESFEAKNKGASSSQNGGDDTPIQNSGSYNDDRGDPDDPRVRLKRDCVGVLAAFKLLEPPHQLIIIANTHLYWDPEWADVKLAQAKYLLTRLAQFQRMLGKRFNCKPPIIVSGDFNSTPGDEVYQYLTSDVTPNKKEAICTAKGLESPGENPIPLSSLYAFIGGEPPFTNCTPGFTGTLDYILFSDSACLKPASFLKLPSVGSPDILGGLPNDSHPSDHLPIGADFEIY